MNATFLQSVREQSAVLIVHIICKIWVHLRRRSNTKEHTVGLAVRKKEVDMLETGDIREDVGALKLIDMLLFVSRRQTWATTSYPAVLLPSKPM
jgi:hypothetical protein